MNTLVGTKTSSETADNVSAGAIQAEAFRVSWPATGSARGGTTYAAIDRLPALEGITAERIPISEVPDVWLADVLPKCDSAKKEHSLYTPIEAAVEGGALYRNVAEGGLSVCKSCTCYEGSLATECPGEPVNGDLQDKIYGGVLDFKNGRWVGLSAELALDALSPDQRSALVTFKNEHGRFWKSELQAGWERARYPGALQAIRNQFGPVWLNRLKPSDFAAVEPSSVDVFCALAQLGEDPSMGLAETVLAGLDERGRDRVVRAGSAIEPKLAALRIAITESRLVKNVTTPVESFHASSRPSDNGFAPV